MTFGQGQRMTLTFDTHSTSLTHLAECKKKKITFSHTKAYVTKFDLDVKQVKVNQRSQFERPW